MSVTKLAHSVGNSMRDNSPAILTGLGVSGVITTAYLTAQAAWNAGLQLHFAETMEGEKYSHQDTIKLVWKKFIPPAISGGLTIASILAASRITSKRTAAAYSLLSVSNQAMVEYADKVREKLGENKERAIRDEIAQDKVNANPPGTIIVTGSGTSLCFEVHTGRYFQCDMETLRRAQNDINAMLFKQDVASLSDFYDMIGLPETSVSDECGWEVYRNMELIFSSVLSPEGKPCLAFAYNYVKMRGQHERW